jgi:hypothetical protein
VTVRAGDVKNIQKRKKEKKKKEKKVAPDEFVCAQLGHR